MTTRYNLSDDETFVSGRSQKKAAALLNEAEKQGLDKTVVRTTSGGYIVPKSLVEEVEQTPEAKARGEAPEVKTEEAKTEEETPKDEAPKDEAPAGDTGATTTVTEETGKTEEPKPFDPADHDIPAVKAHFAEADEEERDRLIAAEKSGKARKTLLSELEGTGS